MLISNKFDVDTDTNDILSTANDQASEIDLIFFFLLLLYYLTYTETASTHFYLSVTVIIWAT